MPLFARREYDVGMFVSYLESLKYTGHLFPIALLRVYLGYTYLERALERLNGDYLIQPHLAGMISEWLPRSTAPMWYKSALDSLVVPNWQVFAYTITYTEFLIGLSFLIGFFVRPTAILGALLALNFIYNSPPLLVDFHKLHMILFILLAWIGAGRCMGLDYFFFKRRRGFSW